MSERKSYFRRNMLKIIVMIVLLAVLLYVAFIWSNTEIKRRLPMKYEEYVTKYAQECGVDPYLVYAIISAESSFRPDAESSAGAVGLMQMMPATATWLTEKYGLPEGELTDPETSIRLGCYMLRYLSGRFGDDKTCLLAAYNAGEGNVSQWLEKYSPDGKTLTTIPYRETSNYVKKVTARYEIYQEIYENDPDVSGN